MLGEFHYLSTVSGGGFAGGWLQTFIRQCGSIAEAERQLGGSGNEIFAKLRRYTNYLTPEVGILSSDTWAGIVLYIRNTILNWLIIFPLLLFVPLALLAYRTALEAARGSTLWLPLVLGSAALFGPAQYPRPRPAIRPVNMRPTAGIFMLRRAPVRWSCP